MTILGVTAQTKRHIMMFNTLIEKVNNHDEFHEELRKFDTTTKGVVQELFARQYFLAYAKLHGIKRYYARILGDEVPEEVHTLDMGSDGVIEHEDGTISLVQIKYRSNYLQFLNRSCIGGMALEALGVGEKFAYLYLFSNTAYAPKNLSDREKRVLKFILMDKLAECDWSRIQPIDPGRSDDNVCKPAPPLRAWQKTAHEFVYEDGASEFGRKTVVAACGAGKTRFTDSVINKRATDPDTGESYYVYDNALVIVPNLHLLSQWFENIALWNPDRKYLLVGSDSDSDTPVPYTLTTDLDVLIDKCGESNLICICTYQSLPRLIECESWWFDVAVCDEAHVTAGSGVFSIPTREHFISDNILFITATPRVYKGTVSESYTSMDDETVYGPQHVYSFKEAIADEIISDYRIVVGQGKGDYDTIEFNAKFLRRSIKKQDLNSVLVCSSNHKQSAALCEAFKRKFKGPHRVILMPSGANAKAKAIVINYINTGKPVIIFNVRVFSLGSDLVPLESVMLAGNKGSIIDTVQTVSRCLRKHPDKEYGVILVPCLIETDDFKGPGNFPTLRNFLSALATVDSSIIDEVILRRKGSSSGKIVTDMVLGSSETIESTVDELDNFDLKMFTALGESVGFGPHVKFQALKEFCETEGRLPRQKEEYEEIKVGITLNSLLDDKKYKYTRKEWLDQLLNIKSISHDLQKRLDNIQLGILKKSRNVTFEFKIRLLVDFCTIMKRLPSRGERYCGIDLSHVLSKILLDKDIDNRDTILNKILENEHVRSQLEKRIDNINNKSSTKSRLIQPSERFEILYEFCMTNGKIPEYKEIYKNIKIGIFLNNLLSKDGYYSGDRSAWINRLLGIESIHIKIKGRLDLVNSEKIRLARAISPGKRFEILKEYCIEHKKLPTSTHEYKNIKIGKFLDNLLTGNMYKKDRDLWISELLLNDCINADLQKRINNRDDKYAKKSRMVSPTQKFCILKKFCYSNARLPKDNEKYKNINIGSFLMSLLSGKLYKSTRVEWINEILTIESVKDEFKERLIKRGTYPFDDIDEEEDE